MQQPVKENLRKSAQEAFRRGSFELYRENGDRAGIEVATTGDMMLAIVSDDLRADALALGYDPVTLVRLAYIAASRSEVDLAHFGHSACDCGQDVIQDGRRWCIKCELTDDALMDRDNLLATSSLDNVGRLPAKKVA